MSLPKITTWLLPGSPAKYLNYPLCQGGEKTGPKEKQGREWLKMGMFVKPLFVIKVFLKYMKDILKMYIIPVSQQHNDLHLFGVLSNFYPYGYIASKFIKLYIYYTFKNFMRFVTLF